MKVPRFKILNQKYRANIGKYCPRDKFDAVRIMVMVDISETLAMIYDAIVSAVPEDDGR